MSGDRGAASVLVLSATVLLVAVSMPVALIASVLTSHRQAVRAADLSALAGAQYSLVDESIACTWAARVASANGARLLGCALSSGALVVHVGVDTGIELAPVVTASARAGVR